MTTLEQVISGTLEDWKNLAPTTYESRVRYFEKLNRMAKGKKIDCPCQELFTAFLSDTGNSKELKSLHRQVLKKLDAYCGTHFVGLDGKPLNPEPLPSLEESIQYLNGREYPLDDSIRLGPLVTWTMNVLQPLVLSNSTRGQYLNSLKEYIHFAEKTNNSLFSRSNAEDFLRENDHKLLFRQQHEWKWKQHRRAVLTLLYVADNGHFKWHQFRRVDETLWLNGELESVKLSYLESLKTGNLKEQTIGLYGYVAHYGLFSLELPSKDELYCMDYQQVLTMIRYFKGRCNSNSMRTITPIIRHFLRFLFENKYTERDLSTTIMTPKQSSRQAKGHIRFEDELKLSAALENTSKRDKAIIVMAMQTGLREIDIVQLKFSEIDWVNDKIQLFQKKTGRLITLPLLPDIGNALMDYILNERPMSAAGFEEYVFLRMQAPFFRVRSTYALTSKLLKNLGIKPVNTSKMGLHTLRHSLVHRLLDNDISHDVITDVLGHKEKASDKAYLSLDDAMLKECALTLQIDGVTGRVRT
jgi:integrase